MRWHCAWPSTPHSGWHDVPALLVGLTGGIASGKSTVAGLLAGHGAVLIDSDELAHAVVAPGTDGLARVVERFGPGVLRSDGALDRPALGRLVFSDERARADLNAIVHPAVRARAAELVAQAPADAIVVRVIPLLVETGQEADFDVVVVVDAPESVQVERLMGRSGLTDEDARSRVAAQASRAERLAAADFVIDNSGTPDQMAARVARLWSELVECAGARGDAE